MRNSFFRQAGLLGVSLFGLVGCATQRTCTTCNQGHVAGKTSAGSTMMAAKPVEAAIPVWVVRKRGGTAGPRYEMVHNIPANLPAEVVAKETLPQPSTTTSLKLPETASPFNASKVQDRPAVAVKVADDLKIPAQGIATAKPAVDAAPAMTLEVPAPAVQTPVVKSDIGANPNLKPGEREIVRENVNRTYANADDHSWLMGELEFLHSKKTWRIRYAGLDKEDRFGGCVTLVGCEDKLAAFRNGDMVKVEGFVVDTASRQPSPDYKVTDIVPLVTREVVETK